MTAACSTSIPKASSPDWTTTFPPVAADSLSNALKVIGSDPATGPQTYPVAVLSAAVFARGDDHPNTAMPEWQNMTTRLCGPDGLLTAALANGWNVVVTGYIDSTGPMGPGTKNASLPITRATAAIALIVKACAMPHDRIKPRRGGVAGGGAGARKVVVTLDRTKNKEGS